MRFRADAARRSSASWVSKLRAGAALSLAGCSSGRSVSARSMKAPVFIANHCAEVISRRYSRLRGHHARKVCPGHHNRMSSFHHTEAISRSPQSPGRYLDEKFRILRLSAEKHCFSPLSPTAHSARVYIYTKSEAPKSLGTSLCFVVFT